MSRRLRRSVPHRATTELPIRSTSRSHVGRIRRINEDRVFDRADLGLWAVADGMGGHRRGDKAAETAIECLAALTLPFDSRQLCAAVERANEQVYRAFGGQSGTTLVMLQIESGVGTLRWAGDSRAYRIRKDRLELLTRDHSVVQELVEAGLMDTAQAASHPQANVITRALGAAQQLELESVSVELVQGDRLLLCSDGLSRTLGESDLRANISITEQADQLLANSLRRDGSDNTSLILIESEVPKKDSTR